MSSKIPLHDHEELEGVLLADGLDDAFIGCAFRAGVQLAVYSIPKCIEVLVERDGMTHEEASECLEFNTFCAWVGEKTPIFVYDGDDDDETLDV